METNKMTSNASMIRAPFSIGVAALGAVCLIFNDFALQWQSAPDWLKAVPFTAFVSALWLLITGIALLFERTQPIGAILAATLFGLWAFAFHGPLLAGQPSQVYLWLGVCEPGCLMAAALAVAGTNLSNVVVGARVVLAARIVFGMCAIVFGISHFIYADITTAMVPEWLPYKTVWTYLTGAGHLLAGLALVSGVQARAAAGMEAAMCLCFVGLLHLPRLIATPSSQMEWTMTCIAISITGAAWIIRNYATAPVEASAILPSAQKA